MRHAKISPPFATKIDNAMISVFFLSIISDEQTKQTWILWLLTSCSNVSNADLNIHNIEIEHLIGSMTTTMALQASVNEKIFYL